MQPIIIPIILHVLMFLPLLLNALEKQRDSESLLGHASLNKPFLLEAFALPVRPRCAQQVCGPNPAKASNYRIPLLVIVKFH